MQGKRLSILTILMIIVLVMAGCASTGNLQNVAKAPAATSVQAGSATGPAVEAKPTDNISKTQSLPSNSSGQTNSTGGLTVKIDAQNSEARYRVREQLVKNDLPNDAVGRTKDISGSITIKPDGTIDSTNSKIVVNVASLKTDQNMRDNFVRRNVLQTAQYPEVTFVPTQVSGLTWPLPQTGPVNFKLSGNLTIRDVTKPVTWEVSGNIQDGNTAQASGLAKTTFKFEDFNLNQPQVPVVLSIVDKIDLEVDVVLQSGG
jgi:polyisoprenoid-binding protein YceI